MIRIFLILFFLFCVSNAKMVYVPCEPSIGANTPILENKIKNKTISIQNRAKYLERRYEEYLIKLKDYNERLLSMKLLQDEKNKLLIDNKSHLKEIKHIYYHRSEKSEK